MVSKAGVPVTFDRIAKSFGPVKVLEELSLSVAPGEFLVLLGAFLLWHNLRRLMGARRAVPPPSRQVEAAFGRSQRNTGRGS